MNSNELESAQPSQGRTRRGVLCARCDHLNPPHLDECETCGAHLFLKCNGCGEGNERVRTRCVHCGHRLHARFFQRSRRRTGRTAGLVLARVAIYCLGVLLIYGLLALISGILPLI